MENNGNEKFLPIGSVVLLKGGTKKAMITGFCSVVAEDKTKMYDYSGCVYPEGYLDFDQICLFDHEQIEKIFHYGYVDEEEKEFKKELQDISLQYENGDEEIKELINEMDSEEEEDMEDEEENMGDASLDNDEIIAPIMDTIEEESEDSSNDGFEQLEYL